jgi:hypothetical protein
MNITKFAIYHSNKTFFNIFQLSNVLNSAPKGMCCKTGLRNADDCILHQLLLLLFGFPKFVFGVVLLKLPPTKPHRRTKQLVGDAKILDAADSILMLKGKLFKLL